MVIEKTWGKEIIYANEDEYCGKILVVNEGAGSSWHRHLTKKETFYCLKGRVRLMLLIPTGKGYTIDPTTLIMSPDSEAITILPGQWHQFHGLEDSQILEVSTHDDTKDTERISQSYVREPVKKVSK